MVSTSVCLGCPQVLLSSSRKMQVPNGPGTACLAPLIPRLSHRFLSKITWGDHRTPSFGRKFMVHTACMEMHMSQHGNQRKYEQVCVRKEKRGMRETKLSYSHFPSWSTISGKPLFSCSINRLKSFTNPDYTGANSGVMDWSKQENRHTKKVYLILSCFQEVPAAYYKNVIRKFYSFTSIRLKIFPPCSSPSANNSHLKPFHLLLK